MGKRYSFGDGYVLDTNLCQLFWNGTLVRLGSIPFKLLLYLIEHREHTIPKDRLIADVWKSENGTGESAFNECLSTVRKAVGDSGEQQQVIENVRSRGYHFIAAVVEEVTSELDGATALQGNLTLRIWQPDNPERQGLALEARGALPLQPRDIVCLVAEVNKPAYLYLIWIDAEGKPIPIFPWRSGKWEQCPLREQPLQEVRLPEEGGEWSMEGVRGMETLLLLARETPLPPEVSLHTCLQALPCDAGRFIKPLWYENWVPQHRGASRGLKIALKPPAERVPDRHQVLQHQLAAHFSYSLSVSFPYAGDIAGVAPGAY